MPPQTICHPPAAKLFEVGVQCLPTRIAWHWYEEVAPHIPDQVLDLALVVPLAGSPEPVGEQVVGLELGEDAGALAPSATKDAGDGELRVVVEDALRHSAEEVERSVMPVTERLRRLRGEGLDEAGIAMRQVEGQEVRLPLDSSDLHEGLTEIGLCVTRRMHEGYEHLLRTQPALSHVILHDRVAAHEPVLVTKPLQDSLRRVTLLPGPGLVILQDPVDHSGVRIELGPGCRPAPPVAWRKRERQHLAHRVPVQPEDTRRLADAHSFDVADTPDAQVEFHLVHTPGLPSVRSTSSLKEG